MNMPSDNKLRICVTTTKSDIDEEFNVEQPIRAVKMAALKNQFDPSEQDEYTLVFGGEDLEDDKKIESYAHEFDWEDKVDLDLEKRLTAI